MLLSPSLRRRAEQQYEQMAGRALRVIAVAVREDAVSGNPSPDTAERELCFVGLIGMLDPPRPEVRAAVLDCRRAGIKPVMITGDHMATAMAIAKEIGILPPDGKGLTGEELDVYKRQLHPRQPPACSRRCQTGFEQQRLVA